MNLGGKRDLDALLKDWPAPLAGSAAGEHDDESSWDTRADATVKAAQAARDASGETLDALLEAPALAPEPGESGVVLPSGEKKMAEDEKVEEPKPETATPAPSAPAERKRTSLKEIAARASQSGGRPSSPSVPPTSARASSPGVGSVPSSRSPVSTPIPRAVEATKDDSGVINLHVVQATATAQQVAAAAKAKPAQVGLFEEERTVDSAHSPADRHTVSKVPQVAIVSAPRKTNPGPIIGVAIAALGIAAAFAIIQKKQASAPAPVAAVDRAAPEAAKPASPPASTAAVNAQPAGEATAVASAPAAPATAEPDSKGTDSAKRTVAAGPAPAGAAAGPTPKDDSQAAAKAAPASAPAAGGKPGDLQSEMAKAVGPVKDDKGASQAAAAAEPAAATRNQNVPEQPSQGSVQAAIGTVMGGAKGCVADADDVTRANVTFSSGGSVTSVSVSGWAAAHGKSGCVQAALKGAKVGPFSKPSYVVGVTIRP